MLHERSAIAVRHRDSLERATRLADEVAAVWADEVDAEARFPREAVDAMRSERLLSVAVPRN